MFPHEVSAVAIINSYTVIRSEASTEWWELDQEKEKTAAVWLRSGLIRIAVPSLFGINRAGPVSEPTLLVRGNLHCTVQVYSAANVILKGF